MLLEGDTLGADRPLARRDGAAQAAFGFFAPAGWDARTADGEGIQVKAMSRTGFDGGAKADLLVLAGQLEE